MENYPGTVIKMNALSGKEFLDNLFLATGGVVMSQINDMTGIGTPTIQNWFQRGFMSRPVGKRYNKDQLARIFIINMLRDTMSLDKIASLLYYINGDCNDRADDIICESELYGYICNIISSDNFDRYNIDSLVLAETENFKERSAGGKDRLTKALRIIAMQQLADNILSASKKLMEEL